jgi:hypothetical protein
MNNVGCGATRHFRNEDREYIERKCNERATHGNDKKVRDYKEE